MFLNTLLETLGGNLALNKKSLAKPIEIKETLDLCDIWRIRISKAKRFTFHQNYASGQIQRSEA